MKVAKLGIVVVVVGILCLAPVAEANKPINRPERLSVGEARDIVVVPDLGRAVRVGGGLVWADTVEIKDASFLKPHFVGVNLRAGDALVVRSATGHVVETITGRGPKDMGIFWGLSARGEMLHLELHLSHEYDQAPFTIDRIIIGDIDPHTGSGQEPESICEPPDFEDVVCYDTDPGKWANVMASVGVMTAGGNPAAGALWCSGSNVSPDNYVLTNAHCIETQGECDNSEFVFRYYNENCGSGPTTPDWVGFRCDDIVAFSPVDDCEATLSTLDFSLNSVIGDPASTFGFAVADHKPITDGEAIYIIQHPDGRPHEITHGDGDNVDADPPNLRYYDTLDTEPGSSGSPIYREADDRLIGLHHCGGCETPGTGNRGMMMSDIYPLIQDYVCSPFVEIWSTDVFGVAQVNGNGNAVLEPGETWEFTPRVRNGACDEDAYGVTAEITVNPASTGPVAVDGTVSFGDVGPGAGAPATVPVEFTLNLGAACGENVIFDMGEISATGVGPFPGSAELLTLLVGEKILTSLMVEDFSGGIPADWTVVHSGTATGAAETWTTANPGGRSLALTEPFAIVDSDEAGSGATHDEELISAPVDCTGFKTVELRLAHDFRWYSGGNDEQADIDVRSGATGGGWVNVANFSGGDTSGNVVVDVSAYAVDQTDVELRFHYYDATYEYWWAVDDIQLVGGNYSCESFSEIFSDDFEGGSSSAWSHVEP